MKSLHNSAPSAHRPHTTPRHASNAKNLESAAPKLAQESQTPRRIYSAQPTNFPVWVVMLRARMFRSLIIRTGIKERNIRARNITI